MTPEERPSQQGQQQQQQHQQFFQQQQLQDLLIQLSQVSYQITQATADIADIKQTLRLEYVQRNEFVPVRNIVYGFIALVVTAVIGALLALVVVN